MIETVVSLELPVDEKLTIQKRRIMPINPTGNEKRISIVTGIYGDELEGQYACFELTRILEANIEKLNGIVDIYPAVNPLGIASMSRGIPMFDLDMNRIFPGTDNGGMADAVAAELTSDLLGSDLCIDIHASNLYLTELPQARLTEQFEDTLLPIAKQLNVDFIWIHESSTVLESTLSHSLNLLNVPTVVVEMGVGMRLTLEYGDSLVKGILNVMKQMGIWQGETASLKEPVISKDGHVEYLNSKASGFFIPKVKHGDHVTTGQTIGDIVDVLNNKVEHHITAPCDGLLFTLRAHPVVYQGSLIGRILEQ